MSRNRRGRYWEAILVYIEDSRQAANHTRETSLGRKLINGRAESPIGRPPEINEATPWDVDLNRSSDRHCVSFLIN